MTFGTLENAGQRARVQLVRPAREDAHAAGGEAGRACAPARLCSFLTCSQAEEDDDSDSEDEGEDEDEDGEEEDEEEYGEEDEEDEDEEGEDLDADMEDMDAAGEDEGADDDI